MPATRRRPLPRLLAPIPLLVVLPLGLAGCDKCGNRVNINVPSIQHSCGDNAGPAR